MSISKEVIWIGSQIVFWLAIALSASNVKAKVAPMISHAKGIWHNPTVEYGKEDSMLFTAYLTFLIAICSILLLVFIVVSEFVRWVPRSVMFLLSFFPALWYRSMNPPVAVLILGNIGNFMDHWEIVEFKQLMHPRCYTQDKDARIDELVNMAYGRRRERYYHEDIEQTGA